MPAQPCCLCRTACTADNAIFLNGQWVCAACKPRYLDALRNSQSHGTGFVGRNGDRVVMGKQASLPDRCLKCGEPACQRLRRKLQWHHPGFYFLILAGILVYAIAALIASKKAEIEVPLCARHLARRKLALGLGWGGAGLFVLSLFAGIGGNIPGLVGLGILALIGGLLCAILLNPAGSAAKINDKFVWLKGAGPEFLAELPACDLK